MNIREDLALAWVGLRRIPTGSFFVGNDQWIVEGHLGYSRTASPSYVGSDYTPGTVLHALDVNGPRR